MDMKKISLLVFLFLSIIAIEVSAASYDQIYLPVVSNPATPTPSPIPPTPTATTIPYGVQILPNSYVYESGNMMYVVGEVLNNTSFSLYSVEVMVEFYDAYGQSVGSGSTILAPLVLPEWERGCFTIFMDIPPEWSNYQFNNPLYDLGSSSPGLNIIYKTGSYSSTFGDYDIYGLVRNDGIQPAYSVSVGGTLYNTSNMPVGCEYAYITDLDLNPGQLSEFAINFSGNIRDYFDVTDYRVRVASDLP
jgi:hypothetical protein